MVQQVTRGIKISVETTFEGAFYKNYKMHFAFGYKITIANQSKDSVQLMARHWEINDALNVPEIVDGEGVIGKKPVLKPGESHSYKLWLPSYFSIRLYGRILPNGQFYDDKKVSCKYPNI